MVVSAVELAARRSSTKAAPNSYAATQARMQAQLDATAGNLVTYHAPGRTRSKKAKEHVAGFGQSWFADLTQRVCLFKQHVDFLFSSASHAEYPEELERTAEWRFHEFGSHRPVPKLPKVRSAAKDLRKAERDLKRAVRRGDDAAVRELERKAEVAKVKAEAEAEAKGSQLPEAAPHATRKPSSPRELTPEQAAELLGPPPSSRKEAEEAAQIAATVDTGAVANGGAALTSREEGAAMAGGEGGGSTSTQEQAPGAPSAAAAAAGGDDEVGAEPKLASASVVNVAREHSRAGDDTDSTSDSDDDDEELAALHAAQRMEQSQPNDVAAGNRTPTSAVGGGGGCGGGGGGDGQCSTLGSAAPGAASRRGTGCSSGNGGGGTSTRRSARSVSTRARRSVEPTPPKARRPRAIPRDDRPASFTQEAMPPPSARGPHRSRRLGALPRDFATTDAYNEWALGGPNPEIRETSKSRLNMRQAEGMPVAPPPAIQARRALYEGEMPRAAAPASGELTPGALRILQESAFRERMQRQQRSPTFRSGSAQPQQIPTRDRSMPKPLSFDSDEEDNEADEVNAAAAKLGSVAAGGVAPALSADALSALKAERAERRKTGSKPIVKDQETTKGRLPKPQRLPKPAGEAGKRHEKLQKGGGADLTSSPSRDLQA